LVVGLNYYQLSNYPTIQLSFLASVRPGFTIQNFAVLPVCATFVRFVVQSGQLRYT